MIRAKALPTRHTRSKTAIKAVEAENKQNDSLLSPRSKRLENGIKKDVRDVIKMKAYNALLTNCK